MKCLFILFLVMPLSLPVFAYNVQGTARVDSLKTALAGSIDDSNKVGVLNALGYAYESISPDTGLEYSKQALELARTIKWQKGIAAAYNTLGVNYDAKADHPHALAAYNEALKLFSKLGLKENVASVTCNIGNIYAVQGNNAKALAYYFDALRIIETTNNKIRTAMVHDNIGSLYFVEKDYEKSNAYYESALAIYRETGDRVNTARTQANIGMVLNATGKYKEALGYYFTALEKHVELGNKKSQTNVLMCIGEAYDNLGTYMQALRYKHKALELSKAMGNEGTVAIATGNIGITWFKMAGTKPAPLDKAIGYLNEAVALCKKTSYIPSLIEFSQALSRAYFLKGEHRKAYEVTADYLAVKDSIYSAENKIRIARLDKERELALVDKNLQQQKGELRLKELELSKKRGDQVVYTISLLLMLMVAGIAITMFLNYRKANQALKEEKDHSHTLLQIRDQSIQKQRSLLHEISYVQSHEVRGAVATILGLSQLFNTDDYSDPDNETVMEGIKTAAHDLDNIVKDIIKKENKLPG